mmetsp:Transcript_27784/g.31212  ORF Transcript_27784/g.31212 Transcript_27784/m.31212 type:complete len:109 (+) Transcript_27784:289-615(+)
MGREIPRHFPHGPEDRVPMAFFYATRVGQVGSVDIWVSSAYRHYRTADEREDMMYLFVRKITTPCVVPSTCHLISHIVVVVADCCDTIEDNNNQSSSNQQQQQQQQLI